MQLARHNIAISSPAEAHNLTCVVVGVTIDGAFVAIRHADAPNAVCRADVRNLALVLVVSGIARHIDRNEVHPLACAAPPVFKTHETRTARLTERRCVTLKVGDDNITTTSLRTVLAIAKQGLRVARTIEGEEQNVNALVHLIVHKLITGTTASREVAEVEVGHVERP